MTKKELLRKLEFYLQRFIVDAKTCKEDYDIALKELEEWKKKGCVEQDYIDKFKRNGVLEYEFVVTSVWGRRESFTCNIAGEIDAWEVQKEPYWWKIDLDSLSKRELYEIVEKNKILKKFDVKDNYRLDTL